MINILEYIAMLVLDRNTSVYSLVQSRKDPELDVEFVNIIRNANPEFVKEALEIARGSFLYNYRNK